MDNEREQSQCLVELGENISNSVRNKQIKNRHQLQFGCEFIHNLFL